MFLCWVNILKAIGIPKISAPHLHLKGGLFWEHPTLGALPYRKFQALKKQQLGPSPRTPISVGGSRRP
jgi:hypothetical protein